MLLNSSSIESQSWRFNAMFIIICKITCLYTLLMGIILISVKMIKIPKRQQWELKVYMSQCRKLLAWIFAILIEFYWYEIALETKTWFALCEVVTNRDNITVQTRSFRYQVTFNTFILMEPPATLHDIYFRSNPLRRIRPEVDVAKGFLVLRHTFKI